MNRWRKRVDSGDWAAVAAELDEYGGALLPRLLTDAETEALQAMYPDDHRFRSTIDMTRHRFGRGEYRYFDTPYPEPIEALKQALYPRLLPIARDWWARLGRPAPWPDTLDEWLERVTGPARRARPRSCCATVRATGTPCTATCTETSCSRCRW